MFGSIVGVGVIVGSGVSVGGGVDVDVCVGVGAVVGVSDGVGVAVDKPPQEVSRIQIDASTKVAFINVLSLQLLNPVLGKTLPTIHYHIFRLSI
jgi:hypothetical protein